MPVPSPTLPLALTLGLLTLPLPALAQGALGYAAGGPAALWNIGHRDAAWLVSGGAEVLNGPLGLGGEVGYAYFPEVNKTFDGGRGSVSSPATGVLTAGAIATYHFGPTSVDRRVRPFVTGGLMLILDDEVLPVLPEVSGGLDWWATSQKGLRFEVPYHIQSILAFRVGVVFR